MTAPDPVGSTLNHTTNRNATSVNAISPAARSYLEYIAPFARPFAIAVRDSSLRILSSFDEEKDPIVVLDHGAGTGLVGSLLLERRPDLHVMALDPNADLLTAVPSTIHTVVGTAERSLAQLGISESIDLVTSNLVLPFCADAASDLRNLRDATSRRGALVLTSLGAADQVRPFWTYWSAVHDVVSDSWEPHAYVHHRFGSPSSLASTITEAGWTDVRVRPVHARRRIGAAGAWEWLSRSLPVGIGDGYAQVSPDAVAAIRHSFERRWSHDVDAGRTTVHIATASR